MRKRDSALNKPFLKWPGSKFSCIEQVLAALPRGVRLIEPFTGSASVALNAPFQAVIACDANQTLIDLYQMVQRDAKGVVADLQARYAVGTGRDAYLQTRQAFNESSRRESRALMFLYLNRLGFNGLVRYNASGMLNTPPGAYDTPYLPEAELMAFQDRSQHITFVCEDFRVALRRAVAGDVVYMDPPYLASKKAEDGKATSPMFTSYNTGGFSLVDHQEMVAASARLAAGGVQVAISNSDTVTTRRLYSGATLHGLTATRRISAKGGSRGKESELIAVFDDSFDDTPELTLEAC